MKRLNTLLYCLLFLGLTVHGQYWIDYQIRSDDMYARVSNEIGKEEIVWTYKVKVSSSSSSGSYSSLKTKTSNDEYGSGKTLSLSTSTLKTGTCLDNADNVYVFIAGWEEDGNNTTFGSGDDDYRSDTDYDTNLSANTRNAWRNFNSNDNSGDYANAGSVGASNGDYRVEIDTWWNWSIPVNPSFSLTDEGYYSFTIKLGSTNNYRVTSWTYQISDTSNFSRIVASETITQDTEITGLSESTVYYVRLLGTNERGSGSYSDIQSISTKKIVYVNPNASSGTNDGTSWTNAYTSLQTALENAVDGDDVWVAKGSYHPSSTNGLGSDDRLKHFPLHEGVKIYGGFAGTETYPEQRTNFKNGETNASYLDALGYLFIDDVNGDMGGPMMMPYNCYHLFYHKDTLTNKTLIDGLIIKNGKATGSSYHAYGGALFLGSSADISINNCEFINNEAKRGGAIGITKASPSISNCKFNDNEAVNVGGAVYMDDTASTVLIYNSLFHSNDAEKGGALYNAQAALELVNNTFAENEATDFGRAIYSATTDHTLEVKNSIFWNNTSPGVSNPTVQTFGTANFYNCNIQGSGGSSNWQATDLGIDGGNNIDISPKFVHSANNSDHPYSIAGNSPCTDAGDNSFVSELYDYRGSGFDRIQNATVDMGAYEYTASHDLAILPAYVDINASGFNDGSSWDNAYNDLQDAINNAGKGDPVWVAKGIYQPNVDKDGNVNNDTRFHTYTLKDSVAIYGGFEGNEDSISERDNFGHGESNETFLCGDIGVADDDSDNCYHIIYNTSSSLGLASIIDGFTIRNGNADLENGSENYGGAMHLGSCEGYTIQNCTFMNNTSRAYGGAIYTSPNDSAVIQNSYFFNNSARSGGALYHTGNGTLLVSNTMLYDNACSGSGGAIHNRKYLEVVNSTIANNYTFYSGAAISNYKEATIRNTIIWGNTSSENLPPVYNTLTANFHNCNIQGSGGSANWDETLGTDSGNNIDLYPEFLAKNYSTPFAITGTSPCVNAGDSTFTIATNDIRGNGYDRTQGSNTDIGAYEYTSGIDYATSQPIYVSTSASGANDGTSWDDAYTNLHEALEISIYGNDIWVSKGTYKPSTYRPGVSGGDPRKYTFQMVKGVEIYGGFSGVETDITQRINYGRNETNESILSGDIGVENDASDNCYHIMEHRFLKTIERLDTNSVLDGFTIKDGYDDEENANGGAAVYNYGSSPTFNNCTFTNNISLGSGGAIANNYSSNTKFTNCTFDNNRGKLGGAIMSNSSNYNSFEHCTFDNNHAEATLGGALYFSITDSVDINNCLITNNTAKDHGGALFVGNTTLNIRNSTITQNSSETSGGGLYCTISNISLANTILWGNDCPYDYYIEYYNNNSTISATHSNIRGSGGSEAWSTSYIIDEGGNIDTIPLFTPSCYDNAYTLSANSPCVDAGDSTLSNANVDLRNFDRIQGDNIDMGVFEFSSGIDFDQLPPIYVDINATGDSIGSSWNNAFTNLYDAFDAAQAGHEIWVAKGIYKPYLNPSRDINQSERLNTFQLKNGVALLGGFSGTENSKSQRSSFRYREINETILSGDIGIEGDSTDNCFHIIYNKFSKASDFLDHSTILDGFTLSGGYANAIADNAYGAAIFNEASSPSLKNCYFTNNYAKENGGAIYSNLGSPMIHNCTFISNSAKSYGGALCIIDADSASISNSLIVSNTTDDVGGGLYSKGNSSRLSIINSTFSQNTSDSYGGAIYSYTKTLDISNSIIWDNTSSHEIYNAIRRTWGTVNIKNSNIENCGGSDSWVTSQASDAGGNIDFYPQFVDAANGDYRIDGYSPCVNEGDSTNTTDTLDIRGSGFSRVVGTNTDMGAYEYNPITDPLGTCNIFIKISQQGAELNCNIKNAQYQWLDCMNDSLPIDGATMRTYTPSGNGTFAVEVTIGGCTDTSECYNVFATTNNQVERQQNISLYPSLTTGNLNLDLDKTAKLTRVTIIDPTGRVLSTKDYKDIKANNFNLEGTPGIYYIIIKTEDYNETFRVLKQ